MADYRNRDVDGNVIENPHDAFVSSSSTGIHTINAVTIDPSTGTQYTHKMGEYTNRDEALGKVEAFKQSMMGKPPVNPSSNNIDSLSASEQLTLDAALDEHDRANFLGKYKRV